MALGVSVAIINCEQHILLVQRHDYHVWCMPGGRVEPHESLAEAAKREVKEEIGIEVALHHIVGVYSRPAWYDHFYHVVVFYGTPMTHHIDLQPEESLDAQYFSYHHLPQQMLIGQRHRIDDVYAQVRGIAKKETISYPITGVQHIQDAYAIMKQSGVSPEEFYATHFHEVKPDEIVVETEEVPL